MLPQNMSAAELRMVTVFVLRRGYSMVVCDTSDAAAPVSTSIISDLLLTCISTSKGLPGSALKWYDAWECSVESTIPYCTVFTAIVRCRLGFPLCVCGGSLGCLQTFLM